jgi:hypothetical protein
MLNVYCLSHHKHAFTLKTNNKTIALNKIIFEYYVKLTLKQ